MDSENAIVIDGQALSFAPGETILQVANRNGIDIPTLCYLKGASPTGACRICLVEVEGAKSLVASCATPLSACVTVPSRSLSADDPAADWVSPPNVWLAVPVKVLSAAPVAD